jgi:two-component system response regulator VicR
LHIVSMKSEPRRKKIMIVEDDLEILDILEIIFVMAGYEVIRSTNGEETKQLKLMKPDLILLDIRLSSNGKEGALICVRLKHDELSRTIPIILLSAEADLREVCRECEADGYIKKPFDIDRLTDLVKELLG